MPEGGKGKIALGTKRFKDKPSFSLGTTKVNVKGKTSMTHYS
jgi:hypothetical protein